MNQPEKIIIEFVKKEEHQKRKEYKHETWFALSNSVMENPDYCDLNPLQFKALIYLYCQCSKAKWKPVAISYRHAEKLHDISRTELDFVLAILLNNQKVIVHEPNRAAIGQPSGSDQAATDRIDRRNKQTEDTARAPAPTLKNDFQIIPELQGYEPLDLVLCSISTKLQNQWVTKYKNAEWVKQTLSNAVDYYNAKSNGEAVTDWPVKLITWLQRDKNKPTNGQGADTYDFIPDDESTGVA